jgi:hypothetical protein
VDVAEILGAAIAKVPLEKDFAAANDDDALDVPARGNVPDRPIDLVAQGATHGKTRVRLRAARATFWFSRPHRQRPRGQSMEKRLVTRYATRSVEAADENQRRIEAVFEELSASKPDSVSYIVLRLADDSFVHVSFHNHGDEDVNPIASTAAFAHFQQDHADRREGGVDQQTATLVGAYVTVIE